MIACKQLRAEPLATVLSAHDPQERRSPMLSCFL